PGTSGLDTVHAGTLAAGGTDDFTFTAPAGTLVYFDGQPTENNLVFVQVRDPAGSSAFSSYASGDGDPVVLTRSGTFTVSTTNQGSSPASYRFRLLDLGASASVLALNAETTGTLAPPNAAVAYRFTASAGQRVYLD